MCDTPSSDPQRNVNKDTLDLDVERMIEDVENFSVQLTWMAYDMLVQRTSPELWGSMRRLEDAYLSCSAVVRGEEAAVLNQQQPEENKTVPGPMIQPLPH